MNKGDIVKIGQIYKLEVDTQLCIFNNEEFMFINIDSSNSRYYIENFQNIFNKHNLLTEIFIDD